MLQDIETTFPFGLEEDQNYFQGRLIKTIPHLNIGDLF